MPKLIFTPKPKLKFTPKDTPKLMFIKKMQEMKKMEDKPRPSRRAKYA